MEGESKSLWLRVWQSFMSALGSIVFGMEDGSVSIFGLVFGVAASATNSQTVLLAGATGAISAAVSMMAGTYIALRDRVGPRSRSVGRDRRCQRGHDLRGRRAD